MSKKIKNIKCAAIEELLVDYLDGALDNQNRNALEHHLASCENCRRNLELQREWLQRRSLFINHTSNPAVPADLNDKIMVALKTKTAEAQKAAAIMPPVFKKKIFWHRAIGAAAIVLLLIATLQIFQNVFLQKTNERAEFNSQTADLIVSGKPETSTLDPKDANSEVNDSGAKGNTDNWQIYTGILTDLPAASLLFTPGYSASGSDATREATTGSAPDNSADPSKSVAFDVLQQSSDLHILTKPGKSGQTLILAAYPSNKIAEKADLIKNALTTCTNTIRIEIIKTEDLADALNNLDQNLYDQVFEQPTSENSWIFMLIGE